MNKIIVSHFPYDGSFSNGVINYTKAVNSVQEINYRLIYKDKTENQQAFRNRLLRTITLNYAPNDVIIEVAESQASTLLLPRDYNVHVRMHCPFFLYKKVIKEEPDEQRFSEEVRGMYKAKAVSSPSYGMLELLKDELDISKIHVFKNPIDKTNVNLDVLDKDIDVVFLLRFNKLKGAEYINPILKMLPENYNVYLIGKQEEKFHLDSRIRCNVTILDHVEGEDKFSILKRSKVSLSLSKFENCSMVILESIGVGTPIVCWDVGGNAEIAPPPIISAIDYEDIFSFASKIKEIVANYNTSEYPQPVQFSDIIDSINKDFINGSTHVENNITSPGDIYKGLSYKAEHESRSHIPYELNGNSLSSLEARPLKFLALTNNEKTTLNIKNYFKNNNSEITIISRKNIKSGADNVLIFDWLSKLKNLHEIIKEINPDVILLDNPYFSDENKKNVFTRILKKPVAFILESNLTYLIDRHGWRNDSYLSGRKINLAESHVSEAYPKKRSNILVVGSNKHKSIEFILQQISEKLKSESNVLHAFISSDMEYSDSYFESIETTELSLQENSITDIIFLDDFMSIGFLKSQVNIYTYGPPGLLKNKNIGGDFLTSKIKNNIIIEPERKLLEQLINQKRIDENAAFENIFEETIAVLNQSSYKRNIF